MHCTSNYSLLFCYYKTTVRLKSSLHISVDVTHNQVYVSLDTQHSQHLECHKSKAVCQKPSLILSQFSHMHTQRSTEKLPWRNQSKLPSPSISPDGKLPSKSYHIYVCQDKLQGKQTKILQSLFNICPG